MICIHRLYVLGRFLCACVCRDQICICVLRSVGKSRKQVHPRHRNSSLFVGNQASGLLFVLPLGHKEPGRTVRIQMHLVIPAVSVCVHWRGIKRRRAMESNGVRTLKARGKREMSMAVSECTSWSNVYFPPVLLCSRVLLVPKAIREKE